MKRTLYFMIGVSLVLIAAWLGGFDFKTRGVWAVYIYIVSTLFGGLGVFIHVVVFEGDK